MEQTLQRHESKRELKNNDPLAHVYLLQDSYDGAIADHRMHTEFVTDMGERLENQPFRSKFSFCVQEDEIVYDTGLRYIASLEKSKMAALKDVQRRTFSDYHLARQEAFLQQGKKVLEWANNPIVQSHVIAFSLCPPTTELSFEEAKKQSFKPDRMMASIQVHTKNNGTHETIPFSLDGLTLNRLQLLFDRLGICQKVSKTTLEQLSVPIYLDGRESAEESVDKIIRLYDEICKEQDGFLYQQGINIESNIVESNNFVAAHPEAYALYKSVIYEVAQSLHNCVTEGLAHTIQQQLATQYKYKNRLPPAFLLLSEGDHLDERLASNLIDYLRSIAIPEYLTKKLHIQHRGHIEIQSGSYDIGSAGVDASIAGRSYDGACPSSALSHTPQTVAMQAEQLSIKKTVIYETPKPVFSKGEYDVVPIGSCPVCGAECGTGIRNKKSGRWYCTQANCTAFKEDIYNYVFGIEPDSQLIQTSTAKKDIEQIKQTRIPELSRTELNGELKQKQEAIWILKSSIYDENVSDIERTIFISKLVETYQAQQSLLRQSLGDISLANL